MIHNMFFNFKDENSTFNMNSNAKKKIPIHTFTSRDRMWKMRNNISIVVVLVVIYATSNDDNYEFLLFFFFFSYFFLLIHE